MNTELLSSDPKIQKKRDRIQVCGSDACLQSIVFFYLNGFNSYRRSK